MDEKYGVNIENNSNNGDIIVQFLKDDEKETSSYWIKKGDIYLENLNSEGAFFSYFEATSFNCTEEQLYYCYNKIIDLAPSCTEKKNYFEKIWNLKSLKWTKKDFIKYFFIYLGYIIEKDPNTFLRIIIIILLIIIGQFL
ncbi:hypothetical protein [Fusobacterium ulcerans]|uniref:hypothetical protein n=1 Tax=Fusobacterium ulcerans TaxID=861 RepID=UPI00241C343C|nr:hypothetical protein [Fusobacterium ulcerans]